MTPRTKVCEGTIDLLPLIKAFTTLKEGHKIAPSQLEKDGITAV